MATVPRIPQHMLDGYFIQMEHTEDNDNPVAAISIPIELSRLAGYGYVIGQIPEWNHIRASDHRKRKQRNRSEDRANERAAFHGSPPSRVG